MKNGINTESYPEFADYLCSGRRLCDINPLGIGIEKCLPGHWSDGIRNHAFIHYILNGRGRLRLGEKEYEVSAGEAFIIKQDELHYYIADEQEPWEYVWVLFDGELTMLLEHLDSPVKKLDQDIFCDIADCVRTQSLSKLYIASKIYEILAEMLGDIEDAEKNYPGEVKRYIKINYYKSELSVEDIAKNFCLDRRYLSRIFKARYGQTIRDHIIEVRMKKARELLMKGYSVSRAASLVGYNDAFNFSKMYKKLNGTAPSEIKKLLK